MPQRNVVGIGRCANCSAHVELRVNVGRKVYYFCDGTADDAKACQDQHRWNGRVSAAVIADAAREGWLGPIPHGYFPPTEAEGNAYGATKAIDADARRDTEPYQPGAARSPGPSPTPGPSPAPEPEPITEPEPVADPGTKPGRKRFRLGGGG